MEKAFEVDPKAHIGAVSLRVSDLARSLVFYTQVLGFQPLEVSTGMARLAAGGGVPLLEMVEQAGAHPRPRRSTGLYHFAILVPSREDLGRSFSHLIKSGYPITGAADHLVSEALYLDDPDKNGIEIYRDRLREEWPFEGSEVRMANEEMDLDSLFRETGDVPFAGLAVGTTIGHMHLHVRDLQEAEDFYCGVLGFTVMQRWQPSALFVSAGGYHHHIGLNVWAGVGAPPPPGDAAGLKHFEIVFPDDKARAEAIIRLKTAGANIEEGESSVLLRDPSQNGISLVLDTAVR